MMCVMLGTAYVGSNSTVTDLEGSYPGFIGCMQDVRFNNRLMMPGEVMANAELAQNIQVNE